MLDDIDPYTGFIKTPKAIGSELLRLSSKLTTKMRPLMIGFDGAGEPIPMNRVKKHAADFQTFFRVLEAN